MAAALPPAKGRLKPALRKPFTPPPPKVNREMEREDNARMAAEVEEVEMSIFLAERAKELGEDDLVSEEEKLSIEQGLTVRREKLTTMLKLELREEMDRCEKRLKTWSTEKLINMGLTMPDLEPSFVGEYSPAPLSFALTGETSWRRRAPRSKPLGGGSSCESGRTAVERRESGTVGAGVWMPAASTCALRHVE